jgi:hypothetical protein
MQRISPETQADTVNEHSSLAGDDRITDPYQTSHIVWHSISHAVDHLNMQRTVLGKTGVIHMYAPFSVARAAIENAITAVWLLAPANRRERVRRRCRFAADDFRSGRCRHRPGHPAREAAEAPQRTPGRPTAARSTRRRRRGRGGQDSSVRLDHPGRRTLVGGCANRRVRVAHVQRHRTRRPVADRLHCVQGRDARRSRRASPPDGLGQHAGAPPRDLRRCQVDGAGMGVVRPAAPLPVVGTVAPGVRSRPSTSHNGPMLGACLGAEDSLGWLILQP